MRLIDAYALSKAMYESAFEKDSDERKWDSGCWIRYKMFERNISNAPTIDAVPVVRCKDCSLLGGEKCLWHNICPPSYDWFCADGEREEGR